ncbi:MAG: GspH/FimT family pseudopilin [Methyloprofundus sp.]|nr:GspH/FimT family pseudopilin [Methyloprofundus sp.]
MYKKYGQGFTLTELMITVAIAGIVASLAVPSFQDMLEQNRLKEAVESLKSDLMFARTEAIKRSTDVTVSRKTGDNGTWCYGLTTGTDCDCSASPSTCEIKTVSGSEYPQTNIKSAWPTSGNLSFDFRRGTSGTSNTCFSSTKFTVKVQTNNSGRVTICTNNNSTALLGYDYCNEGEAVCTL